MRYALYFTPPADDPLTRAAARWLGRDAFTDDALPPPADTGLDPAELSYLTAAARRYGFHATLKAPFKLAPGASEAELVAALDAFAGNRESVTGPRLVVGQIDGFMALVPESRNAALQAYADDVVRAFDRFRSPLDEADVARRNPDRLSNAELKNLTMWGYPYVFDTFRFHMTLTGRVPSAQAEPIRASILRYFRPFLERPIDLAGVALFVESEPGVPFVVRSLHPFRPARSMRVA